MRTFIFVLALGAALTSLPHGAFAADGVPKFDISGNCKAETAEASGIGESMAQCVADEQQAKDELAQQWGQYEQQDKTACIRETSADGTPSYVELQTCLEMSADLKSRR